MEGAMTLSAETGSKNLALRVYQGPNRKRVLFRLVAWAEGCADQMQNAMKNVIFPSFAHVTCTAVRSFVWALSAP
jgi:hypothetical protein